MELEISSISHRGKDFTKLYQDTTVNLKRLMNIPENYQIFFVSSALESMERIIQGTVQKNSFHIITGSFGNTWAKYAKQLGKNVITYDVKDSLENIEVPASAEIICITQNDTSTGFWFPMEEIYSLKKKFPEKLIAIDIVSSVPFVEIDFRYVDIAFFSVQKGFGMPAGLGVMIVGPKMLEKAKSLLDKGVSIGSYHSLLNLSSKALKYQTPETPNVLGIYLLNQITMDMLKKGIKNIRQEITQKAKLIYAFFNNHSKYSTAIKTEKFLSPTTLVFDVNNDSEKIRKKLAKKGFLIGAGYGDNKASQIRIANFPTHTLKDVKLMLREIL